MQLPDDLAEKFGDRLTISPAECAELFNLSMPTMYAAIRRGQVPVLEFGERAKRIPVGSLLALCGFEQKEEGAESRLPSSHQPSSQLPAPIPFPNGRKAPSYDAKHTPTG